VPEALLELAMQSSWFRKSRFSSGKGKAIAVGGAGLGYKERPGFGTNSSLSSGGNSNNSRSNESSKSHYEGSSNTASNRFTAMRETFKSQYLSQFRASSDRAWEENVPLPQPTQASPRKNPFAVPTPPPSRPASSPANNLYDDQKKAKKSRWN
ncbi:ATP-dependent RNA helicase DDX42, partial [Pseudolycoriella hygida]